MFEGKVKFEKIQEALDYLYGASGLIEPDLDACEEAYKLLCEFIESR